MVNGNYLAKGDVPIISICKNLHDLVSLSRHEKIDRDDVEQRRERRQQCLSWDKQGLTGTQLQLALMLQRYT